MQYRVVTALTIFGAFAMLAFLFTRHAPVQVVTVPVIMQKEVQVLNSSQSSKKYHLADLGPPPEVVKRRDMKAAQKNIGYSKRSKTKYYEGLSGSAVTSRFPGIAFLSDYDDYFRKGYSILNTSNDGALMEQVFHNLAMEYQIECKEKITFGHVTDGGWTVCASEPYTPQTNDCLVYSFGVSFDWSFEDEIANRYACAVLSFDPSMGIDDFSRSDHIQYFNLGIHGANSPPRKGWKMATLKEILASHQHEDVTIDVLKMDVEGSEWDSLETMLRDGSLNNVRQLLFEIHKFSSVGSLRRSAKILQGIERAGFRKFFPKVNHYNRYVSKFTRRLTKCYEFSYINLRFLKEAL